jgi:hypothetical protein
MNPRNGVQKIRNQRILPILFYATRSKLVSKHTDILGFYKKNTLNTCVSPWIKLENMEKPKESSHKRSQMT